MAGRLVTRGLPWALACAALVGTPGWDAVGIASGGTILTGLIQTGLIPTAHAADPLPARGLAAVLPAAPLPADGATASVVHIALFAPAGSAITGAKLKATMDGADVSEVQDLGNGLYQVTVTPRSVEVPGKATLVVKGRSDQLGAVEAERSFALLPPSPGRFNVTTNLPSLTLGQDGYATVSFSLPAGPGPAPSADDLLVRASSGAVSSLTQMGSGRFTARYEPPDVNYPHLAILTFADRRDPGTVYGSTAIRLMGKVDYPVNAAAGANVVLRVGGREFGPVTVDGTGRALVPIVVPPGISAATQVTATGGDVAETMIDLRVPPTRRMSLFPAPASMPSDSRTQVPIHVVVLQPDGSPDVSAAPTLTATAGQVSTPAHVGDGVYEAMFTPPDGRLEVAATLQASLGDGSDGDAMEVRLTPPMPASLALSAEPTTLTPSATELEVFASLRAADGSGLPGRQVDLEVTGASAQGAIEDLSGGDYRRSYRADGGTDVLVRAIARAPLSDNAASRVVLVPADTSVVPGSTVSVLVVSTDAFGYPVPGKTLALSVPEGGGAVPGSVTTDERGLAWIEVQAGSSAGLLTVRADMDGVVDEVGLLQADVMGLPALPLSGDAPSRAIHTAWQAAQGKLFVDREGVDGAVVGGASAVAVGPVSALAITATPDGVVAGEDTVLVIEARDASGHQVDGATIELFATGGAVPGPVESLGGGRYRASLSAPASLSGPVKVNVVAEDGKAVSLVTLKPVEAGSGNPWGAGPNTTVVAAEPTPEPDTSERKPAIERPFLRARASFMISGYAYEQTPGADPGPLFPSALGWGYDRGGPAVPVGLDTSVRLVVPKVPYLAIQGGFRWSRYEVESSVFDNPAVDNLFFARVAAIGRYPIEIGRDELGIGAKIGFRWDDFITFRGDDSPGSSITYEPLSLPGLDVGLEISAEFWKMYLLAQGTAGFAYGSVPYAANVDLNLGYQITRFFAVDLGFGYAHRKASLDGESSGVQRGEIRDQQILGTAGVSFGW